MCLKKLKQKNENQYSKFEPYKKFSNKTAIKIERKSGCNKFYAFDEFWRIWTL